MELKTSELLDFLLAEDFTYRETIELFQTLSHLNQTVNIESLRRLPSYFHLSSDELKSMLEACPWISTMTNVEFQGAFHQLHYVVEDSEELEDLVRWHPSLLLLAGGRTDQIEEKLKSGESYDTIVDQMAFSPANFFENNEKTIEKDTSPRFDLPTYLSALHLEKGHRKSEVFNKTLNGVITQNKNAIRSLK